MVGLIRKYKLFYKVFESLSSPRAVKPCFFFIDENKQNQEPESLVTL